MKMTNRERLENMSDKELAEVFSVMPCSCCVAYDLCHTKEIDINDELDCDEIIEMWLESEVR